MFLGYHAYGLSDYYLPEAITELAQSGYSGIVLPLGGGRLNPLAMRSEICERIIEDIQAACAYVPITVVVDTCYRFDEQRTEGLDLLQPDQHWPVTRETLDWVVRVACRFNSQLIRVRSGRTDLTPERTLERLQERLQDFLPSLDRLGIDLAIEPAEQHFIHNVAGFQRLLQWIDSPRIKLAVDTATMFRQTEFPLFAVLDPVRDRLASVTFRDPSLRIPTGDWIGQGSVSPQAVVDCLSELDYARGLYVHSWPGDPHGLSTARSVLARLRECIGR